MEEQIQSYYAIIPANVRYDVRLPMGAKLLYGEITALCNARGFCWADNKYFARLYSSDERTIRRWIEALVSLGYILRNYMLSEGGSIESRCLLIPEPGHVSIEPKNKCFERGGATNVHSGQKCPPPPDKNVRANKENILNNNITDPPYNPPLEQNREKKGSIEQMIEESELSDKMKEAIKEWVSYKKTQHKFTYADIGFSTLLRQIILRVRDCGETSVTEAMQEAMANGWKGICWDRLDRKKSKSKTTAADINRFFDDLKPEDL